MSNAFATAEAWEPSLDTILAPGNYIVKIDECSSGRSSGGYFQIELKLSNKMGAIRDWLVVTENSVGKVVALAQAAGISLPTDTDVTNSIELTDEYLYRLVGKQVGIVVRDEKDNRDPSKTRTRVQGYVDPKRVAEHTGSDVTGATAGNSYAGGVPKNTDDIPF